MNRRTFLKSTALSLLSPTLLLKGEEPLKWTSFASKFPKKKELILIAEKHYNFVIYNTAQMEKNNTAHVGQLSFTVNKKTGKRKYRILRVNMQQHPCIYQYEYQINKNICQWIRITDLLKYMKNTPFNKSNINMNIIEVIQYQDDYAIYAGKITEINDNEVMITSKYFDNNIPSIGRWINLPFLSNKKDIIGWTKLPQL